MTRMWHVSHILRSTHPNQDEYFGMGWVACLAQMWREEPERILGIMDLILNPEKDTDLLQPIAVWRQGEIRNGHHRIAAAQALNLIVPVHICEQGCTQPDCPERATATGTVPVSAQGRNTNE